MKLIETIDDGTDIKQQHQTIPYQTKDIKFEEIMSKIENLTLAISNNNDNRQQGARIKNLTCYNCGKINHILNECRKNIIKNTENNMLMLVICKI